MLLRMTTADAAGSSCQLDPGGGSAWHSLEFLTGDRLLVASSGGAQVVRFDDCEVLWRSRDPSGTKAAAAAGQGRVALLTGNLELLLLDADGAMLATRPAVPGPGLTSNLLVTEDGMAHYALETVVLGRRLQ